MLIKEPAPECDNEACKASATVYSHFYSVVWKDKTCVVIAFQCPICKEGKSLILSVIALINHAKRVPDNQFTVVESEVNPLPPLGASIKGVSTNN
jgi:hypothetical protein